MPWQEFGADVPRYQGTARRLLIEGQRTNSLRNPRCEGATGATPPTAWATAVCAGLSATYTRVTRGGVQGVDIAISGTTSGAGTILFINFDNTPAPASIAQVWTHSVFAQALADNAALTSWSLEAVEETGGGTFLAGDSTNFYATRMQFIRRTHTRTLTNASTARLRMSLSTNSVGSGVTVALTVFVAWPQQEQGAFVSTPVLPVVATPAASTRGADLVTSTLLSLGVAGSGACTILGTFMMPQSGLGCTLFQVDDNTPDNRMGVIVLPGGSALRASRAVGGVGAGADIGTQPVATPFRFGSTIDGAGRIASSINGAAVVALTGGPTGGLLTLRLGGDSVGAQQIFGEVGFLRVIPSAVSDADLQRMVSELPL
jgi:hypothetical protein